MKHSLIPLRVEGPHYDVRASSFVLVDDELHDVDRLDVRHVALRVGRVLAEADHA